MFTVEINDTEVLAALDRATAVLTDATAMMNGIGGFLRDQVEDRFNTQAGPDGTAWAPRSAATIKSYERRAAKPGGVGSWGGILHYSGQLGGNLFPEYAADSVRVGSVDPYAAMMHSGGSKSAFPHLWGSIPARPYLDFSNEDRAGILDIVTETITAALEG